MSRNPKQISKYRKKTVKILIYLTQSPALAYFPDRIIEFLFQAPVLVLTGFLCNLESRYQWSRKKVGRCSDRAANNVFEIVSNTATFLHSSITFSRWTSLILLIQKWDRFQISKTTFQKKQCCFTLNAYLNILVHQNTIKRTIMSENY